MPEGIHLGRILAGDKHPGVVYFLAMTYRGRPAVKIGTSERLLSRITSVSYVATLADVLLLVPGGEDVEIALHREFSAYQIDGFQELFWLKGRLKDFLGWSPPRNWLPLNARRWRRPRRGSSFTPQPEIESVPQPEIESEPAPEPEPEPVKVAPVAPSEAATTEASPLVSIRRAVEEGILKLGREDPLGAARKAAQRPGFPAMVQWDEDGKTALYHRAELAEWQEGKVRVLRRAAS